ncbi:hypothetical protein GGQ80_000166 [Sphingomonas jinjuensis]|uniref:STAS domain-containing protein n=1 Tax=Sphingomonas jinjuensis TaxID=535907 RepID=A0A840F381_9SPHN|nr:hypothetical protein [Sphingomonas jinjuensis]MBB4152290.1 hypothetical protein [Sphingomonas jinjuensis]
MALPFAPANPEHTIEEDRPTGVILITVKGFFDLATLRIHFAQCAAIVGCWRAADRPIRVLIDAVDLKPHSPEGQACVQEATSRIYRSGDKVAIVVCSSLVKMQMRRALRQPDILNLFISKSAALVWLDAFNHPAVVYPSAIQPQP